MEWIWYTTWNWTFVMYFVNGYSKRYVLLSKGSECGSKAIIFVQRQSKFESQFFLFVLCKYVPINENKMYWSAHYIKVSLVMLYGWLRYKKRYTTHNTFILCLKGKIIWKNNNFTIVKIRNWKVWNYLMY